MREILLDLELLKSPILHLPDLQLDGVPFGVTTDSFPRHKITEVSFSPIVARSCSGTDIKLEYYDSAGQQLSFDAVIDSVIATNGIVHFPSKISFKIAAGRVVGFALYGDHLRRFEYLRTYEDFCAAFGSADRVVVNEAYGDLMGYDHFFFQSRKHVAWDAFAERVNLINLGEYDGNSSVDSATVA